MASRIKGITVEIGGDTTKLEQSLKAVNSTIRTTQSQLKDTNRLLKLDPTNTELLSQKQAALKEAIGATKEKLEALKTAQSQARQQLENGTLGQDRYDALQREIVETEQELQRLQRESLNTNAALEKIDQVGKTLENVGNSIKDVGQDLTTKVTLPIVAAGTAAVKTAADFDAGMSKVAAISGATGDDLQALRDKAREMGAKTKFSASEAASAMEYMAMAGWKTGDMLGGIEGIMNLAAASGEDLATTSDIVTDALTAFGLSAEDSGHFADILAAASSNANTNVSMMGETFKYVAPIAGALGFSAEDTAEAIGLMANAGIKSSQAGTSLRTIMNSMTGPIDIVGEKLGQVTIQTTNADGSMRNLSDILADCRGAFSQLSESEKANTAEMLVGKNAMSGFLALMNAAPGDIEKLSTAIENCDGTAASMAETMQDNLMGQITILKSQLQELAISFGEILMPTIRSIVSHIQAFVDKLNGMDEGTKRVIAKIALVVAAIGPFLVILGTIISKVGVAMQAFVKLAKGIGNLKLALSSGTGLLGKLGAVLGGISAPVLAVIAVIAALIAIFVRMYKTNEAFRAKVQAAWAAIREKIIEAAGAIRGVVQGLCTAVSSFWSEHAEEIKAFAGAAWQFISDTIMAIIAGIESVVSSFCSVVSAFWAEHGDEIKEAATKAWGFISRTVQNAAGKIRSLVTTLCAAVSGFWAEHGDEIKETAMKAWEFISSTIRTVAGGIRKVVTTVLGAVSAFWASHGEEIKSVAGTAWKFITTTITSAAGAVKQIVTTVLGLIGEFWSQHGQEIMQIAGAAWQFISTTITTVAGIIQTIVTTVLSAVSSFWSAHGEQIMAAASAAWEFISTTIMTVAGIIQSVVSTVLGAISSFWSAHGSQIMAAASAAWSFINSTISSFLGIIQGVIQTVTAAISGDWKGAWEGIKSVVSSVWKVIKSTITTGINAAKSVLDSVLNAIGRKFTSIWEGAKKTVSGAIEHIKGLFNFSWSLPHIALPHFSISGTFSIVPPSVPSIGVEWYGKAMDDAMVLSSAAIFGFNKKTGHLLGGGERGNEVISGEAHLYSMIDRVVGSHMDTLVDAFARLHGDGFSLSAEDIYNAVREGASDATITLNNRAVTRAMKDLGVVFE